MNPPRRDRMPSVVARVEAAIFAGSATNPLPGSKRNMRSGRKVRVRPGVDNGGTVAADRSRNGRPLERHRKRGVVRVLDKLHPGLARRAGLAGDIRAQDHFLDGGRAINLPVDNRGNRLATDADDNLPRLRRVGTPAQTCQSPTAEDGKRDERRTALERIGRRS